MASTIAAVTTSGGGVVTTADATGNLNLLAGTTTVVALTAAGAAVTGTLSATGITTVAAGSAALPAIVSTTGTADTGLWFPAADTVAASTAGTERLRIDSSGQLILKRTAAVNSATLVCSATQNTRAVSFVNNNNNNEVGYIFLNNDGTTTQYATTSDYRLKKNVTPMLGALSVVAQLKPVTYKWKINGADGQGFIAHELQAVVPDCVTGEKDGVEIYTDVDGNEQTIPKHQGIDTSFLVATLTAAIQELKAIIDTQATRIAALEAK